MLLDDLSARPYILRALYDWCVDNGHTPYLLVNWSKGGGNDFLEPFVNNGRVILNISPDATRDLIINQEKIAFCARFSGTTENILLRFEDIIAIYSKETEQYLAFPPPQGDAPASGAPDTPKASRAPGKGKAAKKKAQKPPPLRVI